MGSEMCIRDRSEGVSGQGFLTLSISAHWLSAVRSLGFRRTQIRRPPFDSTRPCARCWKRQSMTDPSLDISAALREAQLQRLEASLASKSVVKYQPQVEAPKDKDEQVRD